MSTHTIELDQGNEIEVEVVEEDDSSVYQIEGMQNIQEPVTEGISRRAAAGEKIRINKNEVTLDQIREYFGPLVADAVADEF